MKENMKEWGMRDHLVAEVLLFAESVSESV